MNTCLACGKGSLAFFVRKQAAAAVYDIRKCSRCGSAFAFPRPSQDEMAAYYKARAYAQQSLADALTLDQSYYPDSAMDAVRIVQRCLRLGAGKDFIDVGAGFGFFTKEALSRGYRVTAIEPNPNAAAGLLDYAGIEPLQLPLSAELGQERKDTADVVLLSQVLEHLPHVDEAVCTLRDLVRPGGLAAIAVPHFGSALSRFQGKNDMYLTPPEHLNYLTIRGLRALFSRLGFSTLMIETVSKAPKTDSRHRLPFGFAGGAGWRVMYACLRACDYFSAGMFINAYFRNEKQTKGLNL